MEAESISVMSTDVVICQEPRICNSKLCLVTLWISVIRCRLTSCVLSTVHLHAYVFFHLVILFHVHSEVTRFCYLATEEKLVWHAVFNQLPVFICLVLKHIIAVNCV